MRNALAHVSKSQHTVVAAAIRQAFDQPDRQHARETWRLSANQIRFRWPKLAQLMDEMSMTRWHTWRSPASTAQTPFN